MLRKARRGSLHKRTTPKIFGRAKELHRNMTPAEVKLWAQLRAHRTGGVHFRNQNAIGNTIVDFCAPREKLIIELDGSQHLDQEEHDNERTLYLESQGYKVIRFWNNRVMNDIEGVIETIVHELETETPSPPPPFDEHE
jgi:very-short-patch-repair endonuclease